MDKIKGFSKANYYKKIRNSQSAMRTQWEKSVLEINGNPNLNCENRILESEKELENHLQGHKTDNENYESIDYMEMDTELISPN